MTLAPAYPRNGVGFKTGGMNAYSLYFRSGGYASCVWGRIFGCAWSWVVTYEQAIAYNKGIDDSVLAYPKGIGAIKQLKLKFSVDVKHIGTTTMQEVRDIGSEENS